MKKLLRLWDQFLFTKISPLPLALFRILLGAFVFTNLLALFPTRMIWWGEHGILSSAGAVSYFEEHRLNLLSLIPNADAYLTLFYLIVMASSICLMLGLFSRISAILVFLGITSLAHRNPLLLNSGDGFLRVCAFWMIWTSSGKCLSLDSLRLCQRRAKPTIEAWQLRLLQIQFTMVYLITFLIKIKGEAWYGGTAVGYILRLEEFRRFPVPDFVFLPILNHIETWGALLVEGSLGTLIWIPKLRRWVILSGVLLHLGIEYSMNIPLFEWIMMGSLVLFATEEDWAWIRARFARAFNGRQQRPLP